MEDDRKNRVQSMRRCFESNRTEEELWTLAYEHLWPLVRRRIGQRGTRAAPRTSSPVPVAKGA